MVQKEEMYCFDLDGTILNSHKEIGKEDVLSLRELCNNRKYVLLNSGRAFFRLEKYISTIGLNPYHFIVCCDFGNYIYDFSRKTILYEQYLQVDVLRYIIKYFEENDKCIILMETANSTFTNRIIDNYSQKRITELHLKKTDLSNLIHLEKILKVCIITESDEIDNFITSFEREGNQCNLHRRYSNNLEIYGTNTKGLGVKFVSEELGINKDNIIYFGNDITDFTALDYVGSLVVTANADDELKKVSNYVTASNDENPLTNYLKEIVLSFTK